jgi:GTPase SAR1 family protein
MKLIVDTNKPFILIACRIKLEMAREITIKLKAPKGIDKELIKIQMFLLARERLGLKRKELRLLEEVRDKLWKERKRSLGLS